MASADHLNTYADGWTTGDVAIIISSLDNGYTLDDSNAGTISKEAMSEYLVGFKQQVESIRGNTDSPLLEISELVTQGQAGILIAWVWWSVPGPRYKALA